MDETQKRVDTAIEKLRKNPLANIVEDYENDDESETVEADITLMGRKPLDKATNPR